MTWLGIIFIPTTDIILYEFVLKHGIRLMGGGGVDIITHFRSCMMDTVVYVEHSSI